MKRCERAKADVSIFKLLRKTAFRGWSIRVFFDIRAKIVLWDCFLFSMLLDKFSKLHEKNCSARSPSCSRVSAGIPGHGSEFALTPRMIKPDSDPDLVLVFLKKFPLYTYFQIFSQQIYKWDTSPLVEILSVENLSGSFDRLANNSRNDNLGKQQQKGKAGSCCRSGSADTFLSESHWTALSRPCLAL